jgi:hypothetical protein
MINLNTLLVTAGLIHFGILFASALVPRVLDWHGELRKLPQLLAQLVWVHGAFIVLTIIGFGAITVVNANELATGTSLARSVCALIALFWGTRLAVQFFYFTPTGYLTTVTLKMGYNALTFVFAFLTVVYTWGALATADH